MAYPGYPQPGQQASYPAYPGYPATGGDTSAGGYSGYPSQGYPSGPPDAGFYPGTTYPQPGYPQPGYPSSYPSSEPQPGYPSQPAYPGGPPQPGFTGGDQPPAMQYPTYPAYPAFPGQPGGYPAPQPYPSYPGYPSQDTSGGGGGYAQPGYPTYPGYPSGPPPEPVPLEKLPTDYQSSLSFLQESAKEDLSDSGRTAFYKLAGQDGEIDAFELQDILNKVFQRVFTFDGFSTDVTRSMVALRDYDMSGKLDFEDFKLLWSDLTICKRAFMELDKDKNGYFDKSEFEEAFKIMGLHVSEPTQRAMTVRYSDNQGRVKFNDFVASYMKLKTMLKTFLTKDYYQQGNVEFEVDEYIQMCMYS